MKMYLKQIKMSCIFYSCFDEILTHVALVDVF